MRIDLTRDPDLLAAEVRRLKGVIAASKPTLTDAEREAVEFFSAMEWPKASRQIKARSATLRGLLERVSLQRENRAIGEKPTLTAEEREAIKWATRHPCLFGDDPALDLQSQKVSATLRGRCIAWFSLGGINEGKRDTGRKWHSMGNQK
jgi:hypothetical protein